MQFFNFVNEETYHFFRWASAGGGVDAKALIADAYSRVETEGNPLTMDALGICHAVRDILADRLSVLLKESLPIDGIVIDSPEIGTVDGSEESLWEPILAVVVERIYCGVVAQALLIEAGKWAPETELPEMH